MPSVESQAMILNLKRSLSSLLIWGVLYGVILLVLVAMRPEAFPGNPAYRLPALAVALVLTAMAMVGAWALWQKTRVQALQDLPARKLGAKERQPGLAPRAQLLRKRVVLTAVFLELPALIGFVLPLLGGRVLLWPGLGLILISVLAILWLRNQVPARVQEVLG